MPSFLTSPSHSRLATRLRNETEGEVHFDDVTRGIYSTDASHYQITPMGVVVPRTVGDVEAVMAVCREEGVPVLPRGGGTSQCGQTVGRAVVVDVSRHLTGVAWPDAEERTPPAGGVPGSPPTGAPPTEVVVQPGIVLDALNHRLASHGVWFPVDPSTANRATLGGMAGNNSAGARSLRYGMMVDNVAAMEVVLPDGRRVWLGEGAPVGPVTDIVDPLRGIWTRDAEEIRRRAPRTMRNVAGYNLDRLDPTKENVAQLLVGSEGTLAFFTRLRLRLAPLPRRKVLGVCHFPGLHEALDAVRHIVELDPTAVELVDDTVLRLAAERPEFRGPLGRFVRGAPRALLLVEFASSDAAADLSRKLHDLEELLGGLGLPASLVRAEEPGLQAEIWGVRKAGMNIVMSMAGPRKPVSFLEDCAVPLEHLADFAHRLTEIFHRHGTEGTWYAHASVGCLHVRPALNLKDAGDVMRMRTIAEEAHQVVREYRGTHSGEHGDGILRSEFLESMLGPRMVRAFEDVKRAFDPAGLMNPGKIVQAPRMDDRSLLRYAPGYRDRDLPVALDWSAHGGLLESVERCNNNGACRKRDPGVMCPSFRATGEERHSTRGRANALRLALTGQFGDGSEGTQLDHPDLAEAMDLCVACKGCRAECPTGVDLARMKLEYLHHRNQRHGIPLRERILAGVPHIAPFAAPLAPLLNLRNRSRLLRWAGERLLGISAKRELPAWRRDFFREEEADAGGGPGTAAAIADPGHADGRTGTGRAPGDRPVLFVDTFTRWFDPEVARAALDVLRAAAYDVEPPPRGERPLCCGRTYLSAGMVDRAREELARTVDALYPAALAGRPVVGLEPSCLFTLKDEAVALLPGEKARVVASRVRLLEELLDEGWDDGHSLPLGPDDGERRYLVHGHCHQKALGAKTATARLLRRIPGAVVEEVPSGCCGMAGAFGYHAEHRDVSLAMGELELLPAVRGAEADTRVVAPGTSCRAQIRDGAGREACHPAVALAERTKRT
ncbi:MAG: FAD-binding protein [Gemmatimonadota bacterium]|nr:FAD-binding protein [Gemmatimonadota bacterium]